MQSAAGPGQPVISSCQREAESTRNLGGMGEEEGRRGKDRGGQGRSKRPSYNTIGE